MLVTMLMMIRRAAALLLVALVVLEAAPKASAFVSPSTTRKIATADHASAAAAGCALTVSTTRMATNSGDGDDDDGAASSSISNSNSNDALNAAIQALYGGGDADDTTANDLTQVRIQALVKAHPVLLFMKGSRSFPQCGFSDTATKILEQLCGDADFETVDVLADASIRQGVKEFSQWPTIPQLYVQGEFIGGSDIMLQMYENGELKVLIEEATSP